MWLITARGYLSLRATTDPDQILVQARRQGHIEAFFPVATVTCRREHWR
ncbi:MAG: hypothetical protein KDI33_00205 [Halioglobus sp.]|nr:hypothetical protein [Halioglobus sp.]